MMRNPFDISLQQQLMAGTAIVAVAVASPAMAQAHEFNVPAAPASTGIQEFARQAGVQILADGNVVSNRRTNVVRGNYSVEEGLSILLRGTGLTAEPAGPGGIITIRTNEANTASAEGNANIVVTGSRIRTNEFTSPSPMTVITSEQAQLRGETDIASLLQSVPAASGSPQIGNNASATVTGSQMPNALGGNGANTLDLRGLGPQRTLFLINGKRMGPAGTSGQVAPVDMNQLGFPQSQLDRVEILLDGASSIYGSDAIGGVVNIITRTKYNGGALRIYASPTQHGGGNRYQVDGSYGKSWSNAYINGGFSWYKQTAQTWGQRDWSACASDDVTRADGSDGSIVDPRTGQDKCKANGLLGPIIRVTWPGDTAALNYAPDPTAIYRGGVLGRDINGWKNVGTFVCNNASYSYAVNNTCNNAAAGGYNVAASLYSQGLYPYELRDQLKNSLRAPDERYMADFNAGYDLSPSAQIYTNLMWTRRDSSQYRTTQFSPSIAYNNVFNPGFVTKNNSTILAVVPRPTDFSQRVDYYRGVLGVKGDLGSWGIFHNWNYDLYGQYALSSGTYTTNAVLLDRYNAVRNTPLGCDVNQGGAASMAALEPGVACVPVNWFAGVANNGLTPQELAFLTSDETSKTTYRHAYIEASASGDLFKLPGGPLGAAVGFQVRRESIDDLPSYNIQLGNLFNALPVERTRGYDLVEELFGELRAPLLRDVPLIHSLVITGSGRMSHYRSFGTNFTYKTGIDWELTKWLALRATQGTGFRAPALYELFLGDTQGYIGFSDPCYEWGNSTDPNIRKNCAASGIPEDWENPRPGIQTHSAQGGGFGHVKAETSLMRTAGVVVSAKPLLGIDLQVAADYFTTEINNEIGQFGASGILAQCYGAKDSIDTNVFCGLFTRSPTDHFVTDVYDYYVNLNQAIFHGVDASIRFRQDISHDTHFTLQSSLSRTLKNTIQYFAQNAPVDNLGKIGYPKFTGNVNLRLDHGPWTLNWFTNVIGRVNNYTIADLRPNYAFPAIAVTAPGLYPNGVNPVYVKHSIGIYTVSDLSIRRVFPSFTITAGVQNVFDKDPPLISDGGGTRTGQAAYASQYDLAGRTFFIDLTKKF